MPIRREPRSPGTHSIPRGKFRALVRQTGGPHLPVTITYLEYSLGNPGPLGWKPSPENSLVALTPDGRSAPNLIEGKRVANEILDQLDSGGLVVEREAFNPPPRPNSIGEIAHLTLPLKAVILEWPDGFEVRSMGYVRDGFTLPVQTPSISQDPDYDWGWLDLPERLLADTEEEARVAARGELKRLSHLEIPFKE